MASVDLSLDFYEAFENLTFLEAAGEEKLSAWYIVAKLRHEYGLKVPNGHIAHMARQFLFDHPDYEGLFDLRPLKTA